MGCPMNISVFVSGTPTWISLIPIVLMSPSIEFVICKIARNLAIGTMASNVCVWVRAGCSKRFAV